MRTIAISTLTTHRLANRSHSSFIRPRVVLVVIVIVKMSSQRWRFVASVLRSSRRRFFPLAVAFLFESPKTIIVSVSFLLLLLIDARFDASVVPSRFLSRFDSLSSDVIHAAVMRRRVVARFPLVVLMRIRFSNESSSILRRL